MNCGYCFYLPKSQMFPESNKRMSNDVLEAMISQVMNQPVEHISFGWQGGEPTLMGIPFFQKAMGLMERYGHGQMVANGLQTNGSLIDKNWAAIFRQYHFLVGISVDGSQHLHDHYRKTRGGIGSWRNAIDAVHLLQDKDVMVNALTVVNDHSVQYPEEIYTFHKSQGFQYMQFIPCVENDTHDPSRTAPFSVSAQDYGRFLCRLFDLWAADFKDGLPTTSIRFFDALLIKRAGYPPGECTLLETCGNYLLVEHNGDVFSCDFFVEEEGRLGNLMEISLILLFNSREHVRFGQQKANLPQDCLDCEWLDLCRGGCPKDRVRNPASKGLNHFCESFRLFFTYADSRINELAGEWKIRTTEVRSY